MNNVNDLTIGNVKRQVLAFFFPMLITNLLQQLYTFVDTAIVGKGLGDHAMAAVGNMGSLSFLIIGFSLGLANGFSVLISQAFGQNDFKLLRKRLAASIQLAIGITVILTTVSALCLNRALVLLHTDKVIMHDCLLYGHIVFGGLVTSIGYNMCASVLRALGDSKTPLKAIIISSVLNIALDLLFIFVFHSGVEGAAIATVIAQVIAAWICFEKLRKIEVISLKREDFSGTIRHFSGLLKNGLPMALMNSITAIGCMVVQYFVNDYGVDYTTAYAACSRYINLFMTPACSAGYTMSAFTGQNYGAKRFDRIGGGLKVCLIIAFITYILLGLPMFFFPRALASVLLNESGPIELTCQFLPIAGIMIFAVDFLFVFRSAVQGMGYPLVPMCSGVVEMVLRVGVIYFFFRRVGFFATAYAEAAAWTGALLLNLVTFVILFVRKKKDMV